MRIFPQGCTIKRVICTFFNAFVSVFSFDVFNPQRTHDYYGTRLTGIPEIDDANALRGDWEMVGKDLQTAIERFEKDNGT